MTILLDIAPFIPPVAPTVTGADIYRRFEAEPDTLAIAVVDEAGRPVGLLERHAFLSQMAAQFGYALWAKRPISCVMNKSPLIADGDVTVAEFCGTVMKDRPSDLLHGFIVTCAGRYAGVGTMMALLQVTTAMSQAATRDAQDALAAKGRFLAVMSHEIRTPLNGVLAVAEIVRRKVDEPELGRLVDTIRESGGVLLRLLNDALDLSRAEASGLELNEAPFEVSTLASEVRDLWTPQAQMKGVSFRVDYRGDGNLWALGDDVRLRQILNNLVSNALKFAARGQVAVTLDVAEQGECLQLGIRVADDGPGVPDDKRETIFLPFAQTEDGVRLGGAGLGLAVCRQLVERMDGVIEVRANPGGGALFAVDIPLYRVQQPVAAEEAPVAGHPAGQAAHVLIADDNATNRLVAQSLCEIFGCTSACVEDGAQAVEAAASGRFDLILMDIRMPNMDGVEATRKIRSGSGAASQIPIIALTANADPEDAAFYRQAGMNGVVQKPIRPELLLAAMNAVAHDPAGAADVRQVA